MNFKKCCVNAISLFEKDICLIALVTQIWPEIFFKIQLRWWEEMTNACNSIIIASREASTTSLVANLLLRSLPFTADKLSCVT